MKTILRFNFQLLLIAVIGFFFQNSYAQVAITAHNANVTTALTGWNGTLPTGFSVTSAGSYVGTTATTTGGLYAIANAGFGYQASGGVASVNLTGTYKNTTGNPITSLQISYQAFIIVARDSRTPNWTVTSSLGSVTGLNWTYNASNTVANPTTKTLTLNNLNIANNATFTLSFASDRGTGSSSSSMIGLKNIIVKSVLPTISVTPASLTFDDTAMGSNSVAKTAAVTTISATAAVTATAPTNFEVSSNGTAWGSTATLTTNGGTLHVRFSPTAVGPLSGDVILSSTGATNKLIAVSGTGTGDSLEIETDAMAYGPFCNSGATSFNVNFIVTGTFTDTNFSVQLSNADGTFPATATNIIGTGTTSPINATISANATAGTNYRIRVLNANPLTFSADNGSNIVITDSSAGGTISGSTSVCGATNSGTLTLASHVGNITKWQSSTSQDFSASVNDIANTTATLAFSNLTETTYFRAVVANGTCASENSSIATITFTALTSPDFAQIPAFCSGSTAPVLTLTSPNGIIGTWNPDIVSNTIAGNYVFTPDAGQCASPLTLTTTINTATTPDFPSTLTICNGTTAPILSTTSPNGISGTWSPATISNIGDGIYTFTPNAGQCATNAALNVTVTNLTAPDFALIPAFCSGATAPVLALTSPNGITGTWSPATVSNTIAGNYVFTPDAGQCASPLTLTTTINTPTTPDFATVLTICNGATAPALASTSPNGISGTWSPATISNIGDGIYTFTPNAGQCATNAALNVTVTNLTVPDFAQIPAFCSGSTAPVLASTSPNGISGTWSPATVSNTIAGNYVFTPNVGQCASPLTLTTVINETLPPTGTPIQDFTTGQTLANFNVTGTNIKWYDAPTAGNELQATELIVTEVAYYASQTENGCESPLRLKITAGINLHTDSFKLSELKYYPNPTDQFLNLEYSGTISSIVIYNLMGQKVLAVNPNSTATKVDVSNLHSGTYLMTISSENNSKTIKVIKK